MAVHTFRRRWREPCRRQAVGRWRNYCRDFATARPLDRAMKGTLYAPARIWRVMSELPFAGSLRLSGSDVRKLRELREQVKIASLQLPMPLQRKLLELMEQARPWSVSPRPVPEMTRGEVIRAIRGRLGTLPLNGVIAAAKFVVQHRRRGRPAASAAPQRAGEPSRSRRLRSL